MPILHTLILTNVTRCSWYLLIHCKYMQRLIVIVRYEFQKFPNAVFEFFCVEKKPNRKLLQICQTFDRSCG